jgi:hypothetical protein
MVTIVNVFPDPVCPYANIVTTPFVNKSLIKGLIE